MSKLRDFLLAEGHKNVFSPCLSLLGRWGSLTLAFTGKFMHIRLTISFCYGSIYVKLELIRRDGNFRTLCHGFLLFCQQVVLKMFPSLAYLCSDDGVDLP